MDTNGAGIYLQQAVLLHGLQHLQFSGEVVSEVNTVARLNPGKIEAEITNQPGNDIPAQQIIIGQLHPAEHGYFAVGDALVVFG